MVSTLMVSMWKVCIIREITTQTIINREITTLMVSMWKVCIIREITTLLLRKQTINQDPTNGPVSRVWIGS